MPSPFPGMDPYLESWIWADFHSNLIVALRAQLNARLTRHYIARLRFRPEEPSERRSVQIVNLSRKQVVTEIEVLTPSNKNGSDSWEARCFRRNMDVASGINLVEIDLLRSGIRPPLGDPAPPVSDYYILVSRAAESPTLGIWPISVRDPLPPVPVPLDPGEPEPLLDVRGAMDRVFEEGRYGEQLDYTKPPTPALREPDASWARDLLASRLNPPPTA